jgi:hypothetical protein
VEQPLPFVARSDAVAAPPEVLDFYAEQSAMTSPGRHAALLDDLPGDPALLVGIVQGLMIYEHVASDFYGVQLSNERRNESHIRPLERILDALLSLDDGPLDAPRPVARRLVGICRHFALLTIAMLRAKGVPARVRCGFGAYFNPGYFEDHWVCEYWNAAERRWVIVDAQFDAIWRRNLAIDHDMLDVPRDRFLTASDAWTRCRSGVCDPSRFGIVFTGLRGLWFIAGSLVRDVAALNRMETLPWDVWGAQPSVNASLDRDQLAHFDRLAALTSSPDEAFHELRARYESDDRLRLPTTVFNALRQREEPVMAS